MRNNVLKSKILLSSWLSSPSAPVKGAAPLSIKTDFLLQSLNLHSWPSKKKKEKKKTLINMVQALNDLWTSGSGGPTVNIMEAARSGGEPAVLSRDVKRVLTVRQTLGQWENSFPASRLWVRSLWVLRLRKCPLRRLPTGSTRPCCRYVFPESEWLN